MSRRNIFRFNSKVIWISIILQLMIVDGKTQTTSVFIHGTEYRQEDGKWYNYVQNRRGDEIIPQRLVVRMSDRGSLESFDFGELGIKGVSLVNHGSWGICRPVPVPPGNPPRTIEPGIPFPYLESITQQSRIRFRNRASVSQKIA